MDVLWIILGVILYAAWYLFRPMAVLTAHRQPSGDYVILPVPTTRAEVYRQLTREQ
jgi:hypothetical protein